MSTHGKKSFSLFFLLLFLMSLGEGALHGLFHAHHEVASIAHVACHHSAHSSDHTDIPNYSEAEADEIECLRCAHFLANEAFVATDIQNIVIADSNDEQLSDLRSSFDQRSIRYISLRGPPVC